MPTFYQMLGHIYANDLSVRIDRPMRKIGFRAPTFVAWRWVWSADTIEIPVLYGIIMLFTDRYTAKTEPISDI